MRGTEVSISEDLNEVDRKEKKVLYEHYRSAKIRGYPAKFLGRKVLINGVTYTYRDLANIVPARELKFHSQNTERKSVSAPGSPVASRIRDENSRELLEGAIGFDTLAGSSVQIADQDQTSTTHQRRIETRTRTNSKSSNSDKGKKTTSKN